MAILAVRGVGFVKAAVGPERVPEQCSSFRVRRPVLVEQVGFAQGHLELGNPERSPYLSFARPHSETLIAGLRDLFVGGQRFTVAR